MTGQTARQETGQQNRAKMSETTITERVIFERETRQRRPISARGIGSAPPRATAGEALDAGLRSGWLVMIGATVYCRDGRHAVFEPCCGKWIPVPGELDELERKGFDWTGG